MLNKIVMFSFKILYCFAWVLSGLLIAITLMIKEEFGKPTLEQILFHLKIEDLEISGLHLEFMYGVYLILAFIVPSAIIFISEKFLFPINSIKKGIYYSFPFVLLCAICGLWLYWFQGFVLIKNSFYQGNEDFIAEHYVDPKEASITFKEKKNLVVIMAESLEATYMDDKIFKINLLPKLTKLSSENTQIKQFKQVYGTGATISAVVAYMTGLPLRHYVGNFGDQLENFLPGAMDLSTILKAHGYDFRFYQGVSKKFAGHNIYAKSHDFDHELFGLDELQKMYPVDDKRNKWGIYDSTLFEIVKKEFSNLAASQQPFVIFVGTMNTHRPGFQDPTMVSKYGDNYSDVLMGSDSMIYDFIAWLQAQDTNHETVIVILSDHLVMSGTDLSKILSDYSLFDRNNLFILMNAEGIANTERSISSFDIFPTLIEAIGGNIDNGRLGLGRSIYHSHPTLLEMFGLLKLQVQLTQPSSFYESELQGDNGIVSQE